MNSKKRFLLFLLIFFIGSVAWAQNSQKTFKVVIDAGHGAHDPGCIGSELYRRAQIANNAHADLFISFHCNASENPAGNGVETYVMGLSKSEANQAVARKENSAILMEKNYKENYDGFNPNSPESYVIFSLYSSAYLNKSIILADKVQKNLVNTSHLTDRGVKQANYWVLYKVAMPSILIEMGFLSNPHDQSYLIQQANQNKLAAATPSTPATAPDTVIAQTANPVAPVTPTVDTATHNAVNSNDIRFKIQILASPVKLKANDSRIQNIPALGYYEENGLWKYTAGNETSYEAANEILATVKKTHKDAFMIAFQGDKKISVNDARKLAKN